VFCKTLVAKEQTGDLCNFQEDDAIETQQEERKATEEREEKRHLCINEVKPK